MQVEREMVPIEVDMMCDACGLGFMRPTGITLLSSPPKYKHSCTNCHKEETYARVYPHIVHRHK